MAVALVTASRSDAAPERQKAVLVFHAVRQEGAAAVVLDSVIRRVLADGLSGHLDYYSEYLDLSRFSDPDDAVALADYLKRKYAKRPVDVIVTTFPQVLDFADRFRTDVFPGVPIVFHVSDTPRPRRGATGVVARLDLKSSIDVALQLHPDLRQVVVVSGASEFDQFYREIARAQLKSLEGRLEFTYLTGLSINDLERRLSNLPQRTIVYFLTVQEDAEGNNFNGPDSLDRLTGVANRPIYVWVDVLLGRGAIGGSIPSHQRQPISPVTPRDVTQ